MTAAFIQCLHKLGWMRQYHSPQSNRRYSTRLTSPSVRIMGPLGIFTSRRLRSALVVACSLVACVPAVVAASSAATIEFGRTPGAVLSREKLSRIDEFLNGEIVSGKLPGAIVLIQHHGQPVYFQCFGKRDVETGTPMTVDTIFPLHSVTKTITSVAAMMLIDQGKIALDDPVSKYIPSFARMKVGVEKKGDAGHRMLDLVPLRRPITIEDLLLHTSGITYGFYGQGLVKAAYFDLYSGDFDNAEFVERLAKLPLAEQPRTLWDYGHSLDVIGRVIEVVSGQSLYQFEKTHLLDPLGMITTKYFLTDPAERARYAQPLPHDRLEVVPNSLDVMRWESGGGGMVSTIGDLATFARMLLNGGTLDGKAYLSHATFAAMTSYHIGHGSGVARNYFYFPGDGFGFGYGFGVRTDPGKAVPPPPGSLGEIKWDGMTGVYFVIDRAQDMFFVVMENSPSDRGRVQATLKEIIYDAFEN
jgi:CubicO group peptidase (beta-lactamase class C family)